MMKMKQRIEVEIYNQTFIVNSEDDELYVKEIAAYVDRQIRKASDNVKSAMPLRVAIMAALSIADDYHKALQREHDTHKEIDRLSSLMLERISQSETLDGHAAADRSLNAFAPVGAETSPGESAKKDAQQPS
jgi:cell division protein ZapA (FtsZ GTPase activity inhibitor)